MGEARLQDPKYVLREILCGLPLDQQRLLLTIILEDIKESVPDQHQLKDAKFICLEALARRIKASNEKTTLQLTRLSKVCIPLHSDIPAVPLFEKMNLDYKSEVILFCFTEEIKHIFQNIDTEELCIWLTAATLIKTKYCFDLYLVFVVYGAGSYDMTLPQLRNALALEDDQLSDWRNFRRRILDAAILEMANCTQIKATYELIYIGNKISVIQFTIENTKTLADMNKDFEIRQLGFQDIFAGTDEGGSIYEPKG